MRLQEWAFVLCLVMVPVMLVQGCRRGGGDGTAALEDLPRLAADETKRVDLGDLADRLGTFDAVAGYAWASSVAHAWNPDASLWSLEVSEPRSDGTTDASSNGTGRVQYRFMSPEPAAGRAGGQGAATPSRPPGLVISAEHGKGEVRATNEDLSFGVGAHPGEPALDCAMSAVVRAARDAGMTEDADFAITLLPAGPRWWWHLRGVEKADRSRPVHYVVNPQDCSVDGDPGRPRP